MKRQIPKSVRRKHLLLGTLVRIPIGMLADRFGGRVVFTVLMFFVAVPVALVPGRYQRRESARCGVPSRNGGVVIRRWRRVRLPLVSMESQGSALGAYDVCAISGAMVQLIDVCVSAHGRVHVRGNDDSWRVGQKGQ